MRFIKQIFIALIVMLAYSCEKDSTDNVMVSSIELTADKTNIEVGEYLDITANILPSDATEKGLTWTSSDASVASVADGLVMGLKVGSAEITAKAKDGSNVTGKISLNVIDDGSLKERINAKWNVNGTSMFTSFEFNLSGNYIVVADASGKSANEEFVAFGVYEIIGSNTIVLSDLGTITVNEINDENINFSIELLSNPNPEIIDAYKEAEIEETTNTDLLCQTWELISFGGFFIPDYYVLFSKAGTYLVNYEGTTSLGTWTWCNEQQDKVAFTIGGTLDCEGINIVKEIQLTTESFVGIDLENEGVPMEMIMEPVSFSKSAPSNHQKIGKRIFGTDL